jgi:hypothetical protein
VAIPTSFGGNLVKSGLTIYNRVRACQCDGRAVNY